jgi:hypothetical protein
MRGTTIHYVSPEFVELVKNHQREVKGRWMPARFYGHRTGLIERWHAAWLVFTGRADAMVWPEDYLRS